MLRTIVISPDTEVNGGLLSILEETPDFDVRRTVTHYPGKVDLARILRAHGAEVVMLGIQDLERALEVVRWIEAEAPGVQSVALDRACDPARLLETMRAGIREFVAPPFSRMMLGELAARLRALLDKQPAALSSTDHVFSFLPAKAGSGASTIALNVAASMARAAQSKVLLTDFDLSSGMQRFLLNLNHEYSVTDAVEHANHMDENLWPQLVSARDGLDVLHAGRLSPNLRVDHEHVRNLVDFLRRQYSALCFDLSGNMEQYSIEIMRESRRVLLVCTPEIPSLHLAREKLAFLKRLDLESRLNIVINRMPKRSSVTPEQIEQLLGVPVFRVIPNDYVNVCKAMSAASWVDPKSELGMAYEEVAQQLSERRPKVVEPKKRKFIEFFSVGPKSPQVPTTFAPSPSKRVVS